MTRIALIDFGEAAQAFVGDAGWSGDVRAYDKLTDDPAGRAAKFADYADFAVEGAESLQAAVTGADLILSLVTADQALAVAEAAAPIIAPDAIYCEMNSVAPDTKARGAAAVERSGGRFVDVAIMAPVHPGRLNVPLLLSGSSSPDAEDALRLAGFSNLRSVGARIGDASAIKMIRSVVVKGLEALTAEAALAAARAGVLDEVLASLDASERPMTWRERVDYHLDRMMLHGIRRSEEMEQAVRTLEGLGVEPDLTRGTVVREREIGRLGLRPAEGLEAKLEQLSRPEKAYAA